MILGLSNGLMALMISVMQLFNYLNVGHMRYDQAINS